MRLTDSYVAPWALPNERFPIHAVWATPSSVDQIEINGPKDLKVTSAYNCNIKDISPETTTLTKEAPWDFVTVFLKYDRIPKENLSRIPVVVHFLSRGRVAHVARLSATIVRPRLEILESPAEVELTDTSDTTPVISANLRQSGFGPIRINIEATFQGRIVTEKTLLARRIAQSMIKSGLAEPQPIPKETGLTNVGIDPSFRDDIVEEVDRLLREGPSASDVDEPALKGFAETIKKRGPEAFMQFLKSVVETWFIDYLLNAIRSHPGEYAELVGGPARAVIESKMDSINVLLTYFDTMGNTYEALHFKTAIKDMRLKQSAVAVSLNVALQADLLTHL